MALISYFYFGSGSSLNWKLPIANFRRFDALLGELAGEDDLTICSEELGHDATEL